MKESSRHPQKILHMGGLPRLLRQPAQLYRLSYFQDTYIPMPNSVETLDFCFTLSGTGTYLEMEVDSMRFRHIFPYMEIRLPEKRYRILSDVKCEFFILSYRPGFMDFFTSCGFNLYIPGYGFTLTPRMSLLMKELLVLSDSSDTLDIPDRLDMLAMEFLFESFLNRRLDNPSTSDETYWDLVIRIAKYFDNHLGENLNLESVLAKFAISRRTFFRYWKRHFHISPVAYINQSRIETAARLVLETNLKIYEIAERMGFSGTAYFCTEFKKAKGVSPLDYRQQSRQEEIHPPKHSGPKKASVRK